MKRFRWPTVIVATLLLGGVVWHGSLHVSTGPAAGTHIEVHSSSDHKNNPTGGISAEQRTKIRLGTFNIHGGKGADGRQDLDRVANCLGDLDFVALNEVQGQTTLGAPNQTEQLAERLGMAWLFAPAERRWWHLEFGNGLLTNVPVAFWQRIPLPRQFDRSWRNMVLVGLQCRTAKQEPYTVHILLTHVNRRYDAERQAQLQAVLSLYLALAEPAVLLGDLNSDADDPQIRRLLQTPGVSDAVGEKCPTKTPGRIDWIIVRGLHCVEAGIRDDGASDHPLVWAELELP